MTLNLLNLKPSKKGEQPPSLRIRIKYPFESEMTLVNPKENNLEEGNNVVFIENIGPGGLRFISNLLIAMDQEIIYSLEEEIIEDKIHLPGVIIWHEELSEGLYQYGVHFNIPDHARTFITNLLSDYSEKYFQRGE